MDEPPICPEQHAPGGIEALALGGQYVEIVTRYGNVQTLISSTFVRCIEKVVTRTRLGAGAIPAIAGDGSTLAYAVRTGTSPTRVGRLAGQRPAGSAKVPSAARLSVDRGRSPCSAPRAASTCCRTTACPGPSSEPALARWRCAATS